VKARPSRLDGGEVAGCAAENAVGANHYAYTIVDYRNSVVPQNKRPFPASCTLTRPYVDLLPWVRKTAMCECQTLRVLESFLESPTEQLSGAEVHQRCGIASGTLYPILLRLESAGWFVSQWESIDPSSAGRPRRRLYRLTSTGLKRASEVFASFNRGVLV
jgi:PadR family transcriptional regulator PadR